MLYLTILYVTLSIIVGVLIDRIYVEFFSKKIAVLHIINNDETDNKPYLFIELLEDPTKLEHGKIVKIRISQK